jgi:hypothetical protein
MTKDEILAALDWHNAKATDCQLEGWKRKVHYSEYIRYEGMLKDQGFKRTTKGWVK